MDRVFIEKKYRRFIRYHTHVTYPETSERRQQINTLEVIKRLDSIGMGHVDVPVIWDGVHLVDEGKVAGKNEIERRVQATYRSRMWKLTQVVDDMLFMSIRDAPIYHDLANCMREVEFDLIKGRTDIDRAIANIAVIATAKRSLAVGIPYDIISRQINTALREVGGLETDEIELLECLPDEGDLKATDQMDHDQMANDRGISSIRLVENIETRGKIASLFADCLAARNVSRRTRKCSLCQFAGWMLRLGSWPNPAWKRCCGFRESRTSTLPFNHATRKR